MKLMSLKHKFTVEQIPRNASQARSWIGDLPLTNIGQTTRRLYTGLVDLNQEQMSAAVRIEVSEVIRPVTELVLSNLRRHLISRAFPLPARTQKIFDLNQALLLELAGSYQLAALDMLNSDNVSRKQLVRAIFRAMDYMARVLLQSYAVYNQTRKAVWHDIHHLYLLACESGLENFRANKSEKHFASIEAIYIYVNLLALSNPYSLRQGEIERLERYYRHIVDDISVATNSDSIKHPFVPVAFLNNDEPPAVVPIQDVLNSPTIRLFKIENLLDKLKHYLDHYHDELLDHNVPNTQSMLNPSLVKRLLIYLTQVKNRSCHREPLNQSMQVVSGLNNIVRLLQIKPDSEEDNEPNEEDYIFSALNYHDYSVNPKEQQEDPVLKHIQLWESDNKSTSGYGLCWHKTNPSGARVGEIIAIKPIDDDDESVWQVGIVRWLEFLKGNGLCMGMELLIPYTQPVEIKKVSSRNVTQQLPIVGLMLPMIEGIRPQAELLLPEQIFKTGDQLSLALADKEEVIRLGQCDETLGTFDIFSYQAVSAKATSFEKEQEAFENIWETL